MVEQPAVNRLVVGSSPTHGALASPSKGGAFPFISPVKSGTSVNFPSPVLGQWRGREAPRPHYLCYSGDA